MRFPRKRLIAGSASAGLACLALLAAPSSDAADLPDPKETVAQELALVGTELVHVPKPELVAIVIPIAGLRTGSAERCTGELSYYGDYEKKRGGNAWHEVGWTKLSGSCSAVYSAKVESAISDSGIPVFSSNHSTGPDVDFTYGPNLYIRSDSEQFVNILTWPWDIHSVGSRIQWSFQLHITWKPGWTGTEDICGTADAIVPGDPAYAPYDNCLS